MDIFKQIGDLLVEGVQRVGRGGKWAVASLSNTVAGLIILSPVALIILKIIF